MRIGDISSVNHLLSNEKKYKKNESRQVFEDIYKAAIGQLEETNSLQKKQSEQLTTDFAAGKTDNIADVLIASKKKLQLLYNIQSD